MQKKLIIKNKLDRFRIFVEYVSTYLMEKDNFYAGGVFNIYEKGLHEFQSSFQSRMTKYRYTIIH